MSIHTRTSHLTQLSLYRRAHSNCWGPQLVQVCLCTEDVRLLPHSRVRPALVVRVVSIDTVVVLYTGLYVLVSRVPS